MTTFKNTSINIDKEYYTPQELMQLRRERIRERRRRKGSMICGQILNIAPSDHLIEYESVDFDKAI